LIEYLPTNQIVYIEGQDGLRLSRLFHQNRLKLDDILYWHKANANINLNNIDNTLILTILPSSKVKIIDDKKTRQKSSSLSLSINQPLMLPTIKKENLSKLCFRIPVNREKKEKEEEEEEKEEKIKQGKIEEKKKRSVVNGIDDDDNDDDNNPATASRNNVQEHLFVLETIKLLLENINQYGSITLNSTGDFLFFTFDNQHILFDKYETKLFFDDFELNIDHIAKYIYDNSQSSIEDNGSTLIIKQFHNNMFKFKNLKDKLLPSSSKKLRIGPNSKQSTKTLDINYEEQISQLTRWLTQLSRQGLISINDQNDIFLNGGTTEELYIDHDDVNAYMESKSITEDNEHPEVISMTDIARIILKNGFIDYNLRNLVYRNNRPLPLGDEILTTTTTKKTTTVNNANNERQRELDWLQSIIHGIRPNQYNQETEVDLFDGERTQILRLPYQQIKIPQNKRTIAEYLLENGHVRYDAENENWAYRYIPPDLYQDENDNIENRNEQIAQRSLIASHIRQVHINKLTGQIDLEFHNGQRLPIPNAWLQDIRNNDFDRSYIIDMLLINGGYLADKNNTFVFNNQKYSLQVPRPLPKQTTSESQLQTYKLSTKQKHEMIRKFIDYIIEQDGMKQDGTNSLLLLQNQQQELYFTAEHSDQIRSNNLHRNDVVNILSKHGKIKRDEFNNILLFYNDQYIQLPSAVVPFDQQSSSNVTKSGKRSTSESGIASMNDDYDNNIDNDQEFYQHLSNETQEQFILRYHETINYMYKNGYITYDKQKKLFQLYFSNSILFIPYDRLKLIIDPTYIDTSSARTTTILPFASIQLSDWLLSNSDTIKNSRKGNIILVHKQKVYELPLIKPSKRQFQNPLSELFQKSQSSSGINAIGMKRFEFTPVARRRQQQLAKIDMTDRDVQMKCILNLLEHMDGYGGINVNNDTNELILSMTPDKHQSLIISEESITELINEQPIGLSKDKLALFLLQNGHFEMLDTDPLETNIVYRYKNGHLYRFPNIKNWYEILTTESPEKRIIRVLGNMLDVNSKILQRSDRSILITLRNGEKFVIPENIGTQLIGPVNGKTIAELLTKYADDIHEEQNGKILIIRLGDQTIRLQQQQERQLMSQNPPGTKLKLLFPFNRQLRGDLMQRSPSTSTLGGNVQQPDANGGYVMDPLLMLAHFIHRAGSIYQDELGRLVIKMNEDEIVVPRIEAINAIETINTSPHRSGTIIARLIDRIGKVQSNKAGGVIITIGKTSFELSKDIIDRANQLHKETIDIENDLAVDYDSLSSGLNGSMMLSRQQPLLLPLLRHSKSLGSLATSNSNIGKHPWFTDDQQMIYTQDGNGDARYLNFDNYRLNWQKFPHTHGIPCEVRTIKNVAPYLNILGYVENDKKKMLTIDDLTKTHPEMLKSGKFDDISYLNRLENERAKSQTTLCPRPRILVIPDDETMLSSNRRTRFYVQYMYENDAVLGTDPAYVMMLPSRYPVLPTNPQLIAPRHYRDIALRDAPVYVHKKNEGQVMYENLAQYLSTDHPDVSPRTVRRMLKFNNSAEYEEYLAHKMTSDEAKELAKTSEQQHRNNDESRYINVRATGRKEINQNDDEYDTDEDNDIDKNVNNGNINNLYENDQYNIRRHQRNDNTYNFDNRRLQQHNPVQINNYERNDDEDNENKIIWQNQQMKTQRPIPIYRNRPQNSVLTFIDSTTRNVHNEGERSPSTSSIGSEMVIANMRPSDVPLVPPLPNLESRANYLRSQQPQQIKTRLSSLTDQNYGRPVDPSRIPIINRENRQQQQISTQRTDRPVWLVSQ
ncbi:unnamed protein product, partial [Didymodactylos carnosus]